MNSELLNEMIKTAQLAGDFISNEAKKFELTSVEYKATNNVVSYVDKKTEELIVEKLQKLLPEAGFITEEGTVEIDENNRLKWIIDPLDGTANFIHGLPNYSVSIALAENKEILAGVVYHINAHKTFYAEKGKKAFCNDEQIKVSACKSLGESLLATGFPYYKFDKQKNYLQVLESLMQKTHGLRRFGSAAIDLAYVACGYFDGFFEYNLNSWDMAAGVLLIQEAGGTVTDFAGNDNYLFAGDVVAGAAVHLELLNEIQQFWE